MGNSQLVSPTFDPNDQDLQQFLQLYQRYPENQSSFAKPIQQSNKLMNLSRQELLYNVQIDNLVFAEITQIETYFNSADSNISIQLPLFELYHRNIIILRLNVIINNKQELSQILRMNNQITEKLYEENLFDISDPASQLEFKLAPNDKMEIQISYLEKLQICQNEFFLIKLPLQIQTHYSIQINLNQSIQAQMIHSPTHKIIIQNQQQITAITDKELNSPTFCLFFNSQMSHNISYSINKARLNDSFYDYSEKYCVMIAHLPKLMVDEEKNVFEELIYFNFPEETSQNGSNRGSFQNNRDTETLDTMANHEKQSLSGVHQLEQDEKLYSIFRFSPKHRYCSFFLDQSNSMQGQKILLAQQSLILIIKSLPQETYYNIYSFGSSWKKMYPNHVQISEDNVKKTLTNIANLEANMGSTFIYSALNDALQGPIPQNYQQIWFILTDGYIAESDRVMKLVKTNQVRVYSLGFGNEFDKSLVEQLAIFGKGQFSFTENLNKLNHSVIELLQTALSPNFDPPEINQLQSKHLTQVVPNPNVVQLSQNQQLILFCYFKPEIFGIVNYILEANQTLNINIKCNQEESDPSNSLLKECEIKFNESTQGNQIHIMSLSMILNQLFIYLLTQEYKFNFIAKDSSTMKFYEIQKMCDRHQFLNPLTCLKIGNKLIFQNINLNKLMNLSEAYQKQKSLTQQVQNLFQSLFNQSFEQQIARMSNGKKQEKLPKLSVLLSNQSSSKDDQEHLMSLIILQQPDGSFPCQDTLKLLSPVISPVNSLNSPVSSRGMEDYDIGSGRKNLQLPSFLMEKVWTTALAIAFLKKYYQKERGQWLLVFIKALLYLKQYVNNTRSLLMQAKKAIYQIEHDQYQF